MADVVSLTCPSCGSRLQVTSDLERFACGFCGNELMVRRGGGILSLQPVLAGLDRVESKLDRNTLEIRRMRLAGEVNDLERARSELVQTLELRHAYERVVSSGRRTRPVRGVVLAFFALGFFSAGLGEIASDTGNALVELVFGALLAWGALRAFGISLPAFRSRRLRAEVDELSQRIRQVRRELEHL